MNKYILRLPDNSKIVGFEDKEELESHLFDLQENINKQIAWDNDTSVEDIDNPEDVLDLALQNSEGYYIYEVETVISEIEKADLEDAVALIKKLKKEEIKLNMDDFDGFEDLLDEMGSIHI